LENVNFQYEFAQDSSLDMKLISNHCPNGQFSIPTRTGTLDNKRGILSPLHAIFAYLITLFSISFLKVPRGVTDF